MTRLLSLVFMFVLIVSCKETETERLTRLVNEWNGKTIYYPDSMRLTAYSLDSVKIKYDKEQSMYTILNYVDSIGCLSCKLQLKRWKELMEDLDSISPNNVNCLFVFNSNEKEKLIKLLRKAKFDHFVYIDVTDTLNKLNKFIKDESFRTLLLDKDDRVVAVGNPVHVQRIRELYENIIIGNDISNDGQSLKQTNTFIDKSSVNLGRFHWEQEMQNEFILSNTGANPLVVIDVSTSCGCTSVEYNKEPVKPGDELKLIVKYKADEPGHFSKSIKVFCNTKDSPISLKITGEALAN